MDARAQQFFDLVDEMAAPLLAAGFAESEAGVLRSINSPPYSAHVTFTRGAESVSTRLGLFPEGAEELTTSLRRGADEPVFVESVAATLGPEDRTALEAHYELVLAHL
jgi:hypothetical protein